MCGKDATGTQFWLGLMSSCHCFIAAYFALAACRACWQVWAALLYGPYKIGWAEQDQRLQLAQDLTASKAVPPPPGQPLHPLLFLLPSPSGICILFNIYATCNNRHPLVSMEERFLPLADVGNRRLRGTRSCMQRETCLNKYYKAESVLQGKKEDYE